MQEYKANNVLGKDWYLVGFAHYLSKGVNRNSILNLHNCRKYANTLTSKTRRRFYFMHEKELTAEHAASILAKGGITVSKRRCRKNS